MGSLIPGKQGMRPSLNEPNGLGGWLILVQIGLYLTLIRATISVVQFFTTTSGSAVWDTLTSPDSVVYHPLWKPLLIFEVTMNSALVVAAAYLLVLLYNKKAAFPRWLIFYYLGNLLMLIAGVVLLANIPLSEELADSSSGWSDIARSLLTSLIWVTYVLRSERVRNTFVQ